MIDKQDICHQQIQYFHGKMENLLIDFIFLSINLCYYIAMYTQVYELHL